MRLQEGFLMQIKKWRLEMCRIIILLMWSLLGVQAQAADAEITTENAWAYATAPGQDSGMVQFSVNSTENAKLIAVSSPLAGAVEIHRMTHENGSMKMRAVDFLALPAGQTLDLGKGGYHVMLLKLKHTLKAGESFPLTLTIELADKHQVTVEAKAMVMAPGSHHDMMDMGDMHRGH